MLHVDSGSRSPDRFLETPFNERSAVFFLDGRWVAYVSDKSGGDEIYARPFPGPGSEEPISVGGGREPVWSASRSEVYYRRAGELMAVSVGEAGSTLIVGTPRRVFADPYRRNIDAGAVANYDIAPSGDRFVMVEERSDARRRVHVVLNWFEELRERVPSN